ncbi:MAG: hypothetical protein GF401_03395 [Chitinivibrionales bacterium]|nr:hypothetical protein [Chitinivibrionales bacterium]
MINCSLVATVLIYNLIIQTGRIIIIPFLSLLGLTGSWDLENRFRAPSPETPVGDKHVVWLHAASLGETKLLVAFIDILSEKHPDMHFFCTATTRTGVERLRMKHHERILEIGFLPVDTLKLMKKTVENFNISRVWLMELELWPSMMLTCMREGIPVGIVNGRVESGSFAWYTRFGFIFGPLFSYLRPVFAQAEHYAARFRKLGTSPDALSVVGNLKSRITIAPTTAAQRTALRKQMHCDNGMTIMTAGCVHPREATLIRTTLEILSERGFPLRCIIVPRHLTAVPAILEELSDETLHLKDIHTTRNWNVCLIEKFGILEDMYSIGDLAFVGGTFVEVGGHNVWEAARFGIPVFFGPDYHTQKTSCTQLLEAGVGFSATDPESLAQSIIAVCKNDTGLYKENQKTFSRIINDSHISLAPLIP